MKIEVQGESAYCYTNNRDMNPRQDSIVFVHGAGMDHTVWTLFARHFDPVRRIVQSANQR